QNPLGGSNASILPCRAPAVCSRRNNLTQEYRLLFVVLSLVHGRTVAFRVSPPGGGSVRGFAGVTLPHRSAQTVPTRYLLHQLSSSCPWFSPPALATKGQLGAFSALACGTVSVIGALAGHPSHCFRSVAELRRVSERVGSHAAIRPENGGI